jgi:hypothetical protein
MDALSIKPESIILIGNQQGDLAHAAVLLDNWTPIDYMPKTELEAKIKIAINKNPGSTYAKSLSNLLRKKNIQLSSPFSKRV